MTGICQGGGVITIGEGPWGVEARRTAHGPGSWWVVHPTKRAVRIGPVQVRATDHYHRAVREAERRNALLTREASPPSET